MKLENRLGVRERERERERGNLINGVNITKNVMCFPMQINIENIRTIEDSLNYL